MSKTQAEWKAVLETEKATFSSLAAFTTGLNMAWQAWLNVIAYVSAQLDEIWDLRKVTIEAEADLVQIYTPEWYRKKLLAYQEGDAVEIIDGDWTYETIDAEKQIIVAAVVHVETRNLLYPDDKNIAYHLATLDSNGDYTHVFANPGYGFYIDKIKALGTATQGMQGLWAAITNLNVEGTVYYDEDVISNDGSLISDSTVFPVVDAIKSYVDNYVNVTGWFRNQELIEYIRQAEGVYGFALTNQRYDQAGGTTYSNVTRELHNQRVTQYLFGGATSSLTYST